MIPAKNERSEIRSVGGIIPAAKRSGIVNTFKLFHKRTEIKIKDLIPIPPLRNLVF